MSFITALLAYIWTMQNHCMCLIYQVAQSAVLAAENEGRPAQQQQPLAHISNILLHGVSPDDYTSRVQDSLAVLGQALRANGARTVGVQVSI